VAKKSSHPAALQGGTGGGQNARALNATPTGSRGTDLQLLLAIKPVIYVANVDDQHCQQRQQP
jgi:ribosome-binding ATPase YchF (GTP1/OBG family)